MLEDLMHRISDDSQPSPSTEEDSLDAFMRDYEQLSTTPPRTRILRRDRSKEQARCKHRSRKCYVQERFLRKVISNGKRYINNHLSLLSQGEEVCDSGNIKKRVSKRTMQRIRDSERDLKLDVDLKDVGAIQGCVDNLPNFKVESSNRFLSLSCKLVKTAINWRNSLPEGSGRNRIEFHDNFAELIKSGNNEKDKHCKRQLSREEHLWQTELKDMIWLELQAWRADRTPTEQDDYLCTVRQSIPHLLTEILNYRYEKKPEKLSAQSSDSGIQLSSESDVSCNGCLSLFCPTCIEHENTALHEVEDLMHRLEKAEALFPSSKAFGNHFPLYKSNDFIGRVKAMCLWYNIMRHHRLKLLILGRQLLSYAAGNDADKSTTNSDSPGFGGSRDWDFYNIQTLQSLGRYFHHVDSGDTRTYRKFIEDVLKIRGLRKALLFLEHLYLKVLRKGRIALEKPKFDEDSSDKSDDENELRRYGYWSPEYQSLNIPSFRPAFLFISRIPLDVIHEFLCMRLETKLDKPSALSIRQLIKELKEGLRLSVLNKQRYLQNCDLSLIDVDEETQNKFKHYIDNFDESVVAVFNLYLNYLQQWVAMTQRERHQKNILEEEWKFITCTAPSIPKGEAVASGIFCNIASSMLLSISNHMKHTVSCLKEEYCDNKEDSSLNSMPKQIILLLSRELQALFLETRERTFRVMSLTKTLTKHLEGLLEKPTEVPSEKIGESLDKLKDAVVEMSTSLREITLLIDKEMLDPYLEDLDNLAGQSRCKEVLHQIYKFTFDYQKEAIRFTNDKCLAARSMINFAQQWIHFVINHCEKGRGVRPRWASYGLDFLVTVTDPKFTSFLTEKEFDLFRKDIEACVSHIMGAPHSTTTLSHTYLPRSSSPSPSVSYHKLSFSNASDVSPNSNENESYKFINCDPKYSNKLDRIVTAVQELDFKLDSKLREAELIGNVIVPAPNVERNYIRPRTVNFPWQRGIKIGQGRFGKVYTAVNTDSGELMAMKEISLQPNDIRTIQKVGLEFKIFEGIVHDHLVRYYGAEVHREELLIFMELCTEGTLESLVAATESGLPEGLVRRYTNQLVSAIATLHHHSIVHRDIKTANIFLTAEGNCLKLGDFGSAVKIKAHTTAPGELKGFVGTQAYMAPEVFMKSNTVGHGRAVDVWSLGCVVIEMISGQRPWHQFDSNYQIMFKVGMGETPEIPSNISEEGHNFILKCIQHNPKQRATTLQLRQHTFLKVDSEEECLSFNMPSVLEDYLKLGIKR
ncbi:mitogen-activated protein kinase kinase kinase 4 isoform X2 [Rhodnius prolixus]|uniref:mitogen-activated protein kinase kinase kinase 4 isoform X2 n=1 Tax=Rhodnius prolixus TaxID=13249 RepID=UPI003D18A285